MVLTLTNAICLNKSEIAERIFREGKFRDYCLKLAGESLFEDLYSEFIEVILKSDDVELAEKEGYINFYCVGIIRNIWGKKNRHKITTGETSPLFQYTSTFEAHDLSRYFEDINTGYDIDIDIKYAMVSKLIEREINHEDKDRMYKARIFNYTYNSKSDLEFSRKSKIPYSAVKKTKKRFIDFVKNYMK